VFQKTATILHDFWKSLNIVDTAGSPWYPFALSATVERGIVIGHLPRAADSQPLLPADSR